ncbi:MAG: hypothetical protein ACF8GE_05900 [Phycisphaerales bacterium JB043]
MDEHTVVEVKTDPRPSWDEYFLGLAEQVSMRSPDPSTSHG